MDPKRNRGGSVSLSALCRKLGLEPDNSEQLAVALTHRSWVAENGGQDNERLEFLGDAVLQLVVTDQIMASFPKAPEGQLSRIRSRLVRSSALAELAHDWELGQSLRLGVGEERSGGRERESVLADACEAVIGAVYLVAGIERCREVLGPTIQRRLAEVEDPATFGIGPKSLLQELTVARWGVLPDYRLVETSGPDHARVYTVEVTVGAHASAQGAATTKQNAQRAAAARVIGMLAGLEAAEE